MIIILSIKVLLIKIIVKEISEYFYKLGIKNQKN